MGSEKYKKVLKKVHLAENRVVADMLQNSGLKYRTIFGANIVHLREIAQEFAPDHELALELWEKDIREMKILSLLIDNPQKITEEQMDKQVSEFNNPELIEQACYATYPKVSFALKKALTYCQQNDDYSKAMGFTLAAKVAQLKQFENQDDFLPFLNLIPEIGANAGIYLRRSIATALRLITRVSDNLKGKCKVVAEKLKEKNTEAAKWIAEEVLFELEN
ncbi:MAG: DNA alkylation repair protein [Bacteroidales bacterium]|nr:DNA alkylation repair protein [Bacteroidales bacterium]